MIMKLLKLQGNILGNGVYWIGFLIGVNISCYLYIYDNQNLTY